MSAGLLTAAPGKGSTVDPAFHVIAHCTIKKQCQNYVLYPEPHPEAQVRYIVVSVIFVSIVNVAMGQDDARCSLPDAAGGKESAQNPPPRKGMQRKGMEKKGQSEVFVDELLRLADWGLKTPDAQHESLMLMWCLLQAQIPRKPCISHERGRSSRSQTSHHATRSGRTRQPTTQRPPPHRPSKKLQVRHARVF